jgi:hypothetical protein
MGNKGEIAMNILEKILDTKDNNSTGKVITVPTLLSECGTRVTIDEKDKYHIEIEPNDFLVVIMGFTANKGAANFKHPNIASTRKTVHEFKHYRDNGGKFWTSRAGLDHLFVIPRNQVKILPEKGYSYIKAEINGVKVSFNVSGGGGDGWTDYLSTFTSTSVNHKLADVKKIAQVAVRNSPFEPMEAKPLTAQEEANWNRLQAKSTPKYKEIIAKMIEEGKKPMIYLLGGYIYERGEGVEVERRCRKIPLPNTEDGLRSWRHEFTGAPRRIILDIGHRVFAKITQIDWYKTAKENAIVA